MPTLSSIRFSLSLLTLGLAANAGAQSADLLVPVEATPPAVRRWHEADAAQDKTLAEVRFVRVSADRLRVGQRLRVQLFEGSTELLVRTEAPSLRHTIFRATPVHGSGDATFAVDRNGVTAASIHLGSETFSLGFSGHGAVHRLARLDLSRSKLSCGCTRAHEVDPGPEREMLPNSVVRNVDVAVFYTPRARSTGGGTAAIQSQIALRIANATTANRTCRVPWAFRLVHVAETNYTEDGSTSDLARFRNTSAPMAEVHAARTKWGADLMCLITQPAQPRYCGVGYLMTRLSTGFRSSAFSVTLRQCLSGHTLSHEMGHNCGSHHDRANAGRALYAYSYGARTSGDVERSIMAYRPGRRVNQWSSATVRYNNKALGDANNDNARSLTNAGTTLANFTPTRTLEWCELTGGVRGANGLPRIAGAGTVNDAATVRVTVANVRDNAPGIAIVGGREIKLALLGGTLIPSLDVAIVLAARGRTATLNAGFLASLPSNTPVWMQAWFLDRAAAQGFSATNGIKTTRP